MQSKIIFIVDGTLNGVLTAIFKVFSNKLQNKSDFLYCQKDNFQQDLFCKVESVVTDIEKSNRVLKKLNDLLRPNNYRKLFIAIRSGSADKLQIIFSYVITILKEGKDITDNFSLAEMFSFDKTVKAVTYESHRFKGFLRFSKLENGVYYAKYSPDNDVTELITPHFARRFPTMPFIIHDEKHGVLSAHVKGKIVYKKHSLSALNVKDEFSKLFKTYCDAVFIEQRKNTKLMLNYMPKRYHKNAPEKDELLNY